MKEEEQVFADTNNESRNINTQSSEISRQLRGVVVMKGKLLESGFGGIHVKVSAIEWRVQMM